MAIHFFEEVNIGSNLKNRQKIKKWLNNSALQEGKKIIEINYIFCSDDYLLKLNKTYLKHDTYTDIITFDNYDDSSSKLSGDIYISLDRVKENAVKYKTVIQEEICRMLIHGLLHLCGHKDKKPTEKKNMTEKEDFYLKFLAVK